MSTSLYPINQGQPDVVPETPFLEYDTLGPMNISLYLTDYLNDGLDYPEQYGDLIIPQNATQPIHAPAPSWQRATPAKKYLQQWNVKLEVDTSLKDGIDSGSLTADQSLLYTFPLEQFKDRPENFRGDRCDICYTLERECKKSDVGGQCQSWIEDGWPQQTALQEGQTAWRKAQKAWRKAQKNKPCIGCSKLKNKCRRDYIGGQCYRCARYRFHCEAQPTKFRWARPIRSDTMPRAQGGFRCPAQDCCRGFTRRGDLRNHLANIHGSMPKRAPAAAASNKRPRPKEEGPIDPPAKRLR